jgi:hypothetical protein
LLVFLAGAFLAVFFSLASSATGVSALSALAFLAFFSTFLGSSDAPHLWQTRNFLSPSILLATRVALLQAGQMICTLLTSTGPAILFLPPG